MTIIRMFQAQCDTCGGIDPRCRQYSSDIKELLAKDGWKIANKIKCPYCLGTDDNYWGEGGFE